MKKSAKIEKVEFYLTKELLQEIVVGRARSIVGNYETTALPLIVSLLGDKGLLSMDALNKEHERLLTRVTSLDSHPEIRSESECYFEDEFYLEYNFCLTNLTIVEELQWFTRLWPIAEALAEKFPAMQPEELSSILDLVTGAAEGAIEEALKPYLPKFAVMSAAIGH